MPDQDIFDRFDTGGIPVHPLPAAEVRRRGDRMRRRRTVATIVGAAAAVTVIALGGVALGQGVGGRAEPLPPVDTPSPSPSPTPSVTEPATATIPESFPIDSAGSAPEVPPEDYLAQQLKFCGDAPLADVTPVDARSAQVAGGETNTAVTLLLFDQEEDAARALDNLVDSAAGCPREVTNVVGEVEVLPEADPWPGQTIRTTYPADAKFVHAVQAGPALLLSSWYVAGMPPEQGLTESRAAIAEQLAALDETWDVPGWSPSQTGSSEDPGGATDFPAGFPIDWDALDLSGDGGRFYGPGEKARGAMEVSPCERAVWPVTGTDRLAFTSTGPEFRESRELVAFASAEQAVATMSGIRAAVRACPTEINGQDPTANPEQAWEEHEADTGYEDSTTFSQTYTDGLPGGAVWQFTRVGRGILAVNTGGEISMQSVPSHVNRLTEITAHLTPEMCTFTEAGC